MLSVDLTQTIKQNNKTGIWFHAQNVDGATSAPVVILCRYTVQQIISQKC